MRLYSRVWVLAFLCCVVSVLGGDIVAQVPRPPSPPSGAGSVTSITCGSGLTCTPNPIVSTGTIASSGGSGDMVAATYDPANIAQQVVGTTATQTLTNKRITPNVTTLSTSTTYTCPGDTSNICEMQMTGSAGTLTVAAPTGTPTNGQYLMLGFLCTNAQTFSWNAIFIASPNVSLPTTCPVGVTTWTKIGAQYSTVLTKWQVIATN